VQTYEVYIANNRSAAVGFRLVPARNLAHARELAQGILNESSAYTGVEVRLDSQRLFGLGSLGDPPGDGAQSSISK
jgi:hypothetical protein